MLFKNPNLLQEALVYREDNEGICFLLRVLNKKGLITSEEEHLAAYFMPNYLRGIGKYSGDKVYPIECILDHEYYGYLYHQEKGTLWDSSNEYGRTRYALFEAIINNINANRKEPSDES